MRKIILNIAFVIGVIAAVSSCYYEYPPEPVPIDPEDVSFNTHIVPILTTQCASVNGECHYNKVAPNLRADTVYRVLTGGGYLNVTFPADSKFYAPIADNSMPPSGSLSELDKQLILIWIGKGAPND